MKTRSHRPAHSTRGNESMEEAPLHNVFLDELADMYDAEKQITEALPAMIKAADSAELKEALRTHLQETETQLERLEEVFASMGEKAKGRLCYGIKGILKEGEKMVMEQKGTDALNDVIIAGAQKVEHYEIATYGTLLAWAEQLGHSEVIQLLEENLGEERAADKKLTSIAFEMAQRRWSVL